MRVARFLLAVALILTGMMVVFAQQTPPPVPPPSTTTVVPPSTPSVLRGAPAPQQPPSPQPPQVNPAPGQGVLERMEQRITDLERKVAALEAKK